MHLIILGSRRDRGERSGLEGWPSGLRRTLGKRVCVDAYRGFESHPLRHIPVQRRPILTFNYLLYMG